MGNFMDALKVQSSRNSLARTENGAVAYQTTGKKLLDLNFATSSFRARTDQQIIDSFMEAFSEDPVYAMVWLFYCRDCRGGMGERRFFRTVMRYLASNRSYATIVKAVLPFVAEYGRWDDVVYLLETSCPVAFGEICKLIIEQLERDTKDMNDKKPVSLLAKWLPSDNTSSKTSRQLALRLAKEMNMDVRAYRQSIVKLRSYLKIVERYISRNKWNEVDYSHVPSQANLLYRKAFLKHDHDRRTAYLESVQNGEKTINADTLFPHDIVHRYGRGHVVWGGSTPGGEDASLEALWKALPDFVNGESGTLVVRDGSGSMSCRVGDGSSVSAMSVSTALAIYFAERSTGQFKDQFITFSRCPKIVNISGLGTLKEKLDRCYRETECSNTNIEAVFDLILNAAVNNHCAQNDLPSTVLIVSDMEFDGATTCRKSEMKSLFDRIKKRFEEHGYQMPKLAFWNVCSRTNGMPLRENENGVALVSGFAPATIKMVLQEEADPYLAMMNVLNSDRYASILNALKSL